MYEDNSLINNYEKVLSYKYHFLIFNNELIYNTKNNYISD